MTDTAQEVSLDQVMARRFELVEQQAIIANRHKTELAPINEELNLCETYIKDLMNKSGMTQAKTDAGMAYFTTKDSVTVKDMDQVIRTIVGAVPPHPNLPESSVSWSALVDYFIQHGLWSLLNKAVNKTAVKEMIAANQAPGGVEYSSYRDLAWRRGKG